ncbi:MAG: prohibitin family protein [Crocinitomicaceae bacterium]|nr:prohibitin family protein [Crocinitomicaceae bacterium]
MKIFYLSCFVITLFIIQSCTIIRPGEVGVDVKFGKIKPELLEPGAHHYAPKVFRYVVRYETRTINHNKEFHFHSKEGIYVDADVTILYHVRQSDILEIHKNYGPKYESLLIDDYIETNLRKIGLNYEAQELIPARTMIEANLMLAMDSILTDRGIVMESVILKDFTLPQGIVATIQERLKAEEIAKRTTVENKASRERLDFELERGLKEKELEISKSRLDLEFALEKQKLEAERIIVAAEAEKKRQELENSTITDQLLKLKAIELSAEALKSNSKIIVTDGKTPIVLGGNGISLSDFEK